MRRVFALMTLAAVIAVAGLVTRSNPAPAATAVGDIETVVGGNPTKLGEVAGLAVFGNVVYLSPASGLIVRRDLTSGVQTIYAGEFGATDHTGDGGPATSAHVGKNSYLAVDSAGNLYLAGDGRVRRIDAVTATITAFAGDGTAGTGGDGGPALAAEFDGFTGMVIDSNDNVYLSFEDGYVRRIDASTGNIDRYAGGGSLVGAASDGQPATSALIPRIRGLAVDASDSLYFPAADRTIRKVDAAGIITTYAGTHGVQGWVDGVAASARLSEPDTMAVASDGTLVFSDSIWDAGLNRTAHGIRTVDATGSTVGTITRTGIANPLGLRNGGDVDFFSLAFDVSGTAWMGAYAPGEDGFATLFTLDAAITELTPVWWTINPGDVATSIVLAMPMATVRVGNTLYLTDGVTHSVRAVDLTTGEIRRVAGSSTARPGFGGDGGPAIDALLDNPTGIAYDGSGLLVAEVARIRRIDLSTGLITTIAGTGTPGYSGNGVPALAAEFSNKAKFLTVDTTGRIYITDFDHPTVRCIGCAAPGIVTTIAGTGNAGYSADGSDAATSDVGIPIGVTIAPDGAVIFSEIMNEIVRRIDPATGTLQTVAGQAGNGGWSGDGGLATAASISMPTGVRYDTDGNLYIASLGGGVIRRVDASGVITHFAGTGTMGFSGDGGPATLAEIGMVYSLNPDTGSDTFVPEIVPSFQSVIRRIVGTAIPPAPTPPPTTSPIPTSTPLVDSSVPITTLAPAPTTATDVSNLAAGRGTRPGSTLPFTGTNPAGLASLAVLATGVGAGLVALARWRRTQFQGRT